MPEETHSLNGKTKKSFRMFHIRALKVYSIVIRQTNARV